MFLRIVLAVALAVVVAPLAASSADYSRHHVIDGFADTPVPLGTPTTGAGRSYDVMLEPGDVITATVRWADPMVDLDLELDPPTRNCGILPMPEVPCFVAYPPVVGSGASCRGVSSAQLALGPGEERVTFTAETAGVHSVDVIASILSPGTRVPYDIHIVVDGAGGQVSGPTSTSWLFRGPHCRLD